MGIKQEEGGEDQIEKPGNRSEVEIFFWALFDKYIESALYVPSTLQVLTLCIETRLILTANG